MATATPKTKKKAGSEASHLAELERLKSQLQFTQEQLDQSNAFFTQIQKFSDLVLSSKRDLKRLKALEAEQKADLGETKAEIKSLENLIDSSNSGMLAILEPGPTDFDKALFYGPPGNGKTMAAQMIAKKIGVQLFRVRCESLIDSALGRTESNMSYVMDWLAHAGPSVVLFDECEAIFPQRNSSSDQCSKTIVRSMQIFWQELDRWETPQMFLMATNRIGDLDDALLSRIELKVEFLPPTAEQALKVVSYWAETLHEYGAEIWSAELKAKINRGEMPESFRELWQWVSDSVRLSIVNANS